MSVFAWNDKFSVNVEALDRQHKYFLDLLNTLDDQIRRDNDEETVRVAVGKLFNYAAFHFRDEENILYACGFPGIREQRLEHSYFMKQVKEMDDSLQNGGALQLGSVVSVLKDWFMNHIMNEDGKYAAYIRIRYSSESLILNTV